MESNHDLISLFEHDLFGKPASTFPDHALDRDLINAFNDAPCWSDHENLRSAVADGRHDRRSSLEQAPAVAGIRGQSRGQSRPACRSDRALPSQEGRARIDWDRPRRSYSACPTAGFATTLRAACETEAADGI